MITQQQIAYEWAVENDATVHAMLNHDRTQPLENIIAALARDKVQLMNKIMELHAIAPRKITMPDGKVMVWRCPDHMVPDV